MIKRGSMIYLNLIYRQCKNSAVTSNMPGKVVKFFHKGWGQHLG